MSGGAALDPLCEKMALGSAPFLIQRPIVVTPNDVRLCRPAETVLELL